MKQPYEKVIQLEILSIVIGASLGIFAIIKGYYFLLFMCFYLIAISFLCEAIVEWYLLHRPNAGKQFFRAMILVIFTTYLIIKL